MENNRLVVTCKEDIGALEQTPCFILTPDSDPDGAGEVEFNLQDCYRALLEQLKGFPFQSAAHYLGALAAEDTALTNGQDGVWASQAEVDSYFTLAAKDLPEGWRKVWFKDCPGILKPTPPQDRAYAHNPFYARLGATESLRAAHFGRLLLGSVFKKRHQIAKIETPCPRFEAGLSLD